MKIPWAVTILVVMILFAVIPEQGHAQDIGDGVCVAFCDDYTPPPDDPVGDRGYYNTPRGTGWFCEARAPDGSWGWGEAAGKGTAQSNALSECGKHSNACRISYCKLGGGKGYSPDRNARKSNPGNGKLKPSVSQQKKIQQQNQMRKWRIRADAENKKCLSAFNEKFWYDDNVSRLIKHCSAALEYCRKGRANCRIHTWNVKLAQAIKARHEKRYDDAVAYYDDALAMCGDGDDCPGIGNFSQLQGMRASLLEKRRTAAAKADLMRNADSRQDRIADAARTRQSEPADAPNSGLAFIDPGTSVPSAKANYLLDALQAGDGDWNKSIEDLEAVVQAEPGNKSARDALLYLKGLYQGNLAVSKLNNARYRMGINAWMTGDYKSAAFHLAESYAADPSDFGSLEAYGLVSGLAQSEQDREWSVNCGAGDCPPPDPLSYPKELASLLNSPAYLLLDRDQRSHLIEERTRYAEANADPDKTAAIQFVEGLAAWDDFRQRVLEGATDPENTDKMVKAYIRLGTGDYDGALDILGDIALNDDAATFAYFHARGLAEGYTPPAPFLPPGDMEKRLEAVWRDLHETRLAAERLIQYDPSLRPPWQVIGERLRAEERAAWAEFLSDPFAAGADLARSRQ